MALKRIKPRKRPRQPRRVNPGSTLIVTPPPAHVVPPPRPTRPPRPGRPRIPPPVVPVPPPVPNLRASTEQLVRDAKNLAAEATSASYRLGLVLRELSRPERYGELGYSTFSELLEQRELAPHRTAHKLITVVDAFAPDTAQRLGVEKSYAIVRYAAVAHPGEKPLAVLRSDPVLRLRGKTARLSAASVRDVFAAITTLLRADVPAPYVRRVQTATRGISQRLEHLDIRTAEVRSHQRGSRIVVRVQIDGSEAEKLLALLRRR